MASLHIYLIITMNNDDNKIQILCNFSIGIRVQIFIRYVLQSAYRNHNLHTQNILVYIPIDMKITNINYLIVTDKDNTYVHLFWYCV